MQTDGHVPSPSQEAINSAHRLYNAILVAFPDAVTDFESKWRADDFAAVRRLGPKIIPLLVSKLATGADKDSWGVFLYNALENDPDYRVNLADETLASSRIVELNYQRNGIVEERVRAWKDHHEENFLQSNSASFTHCEPYWNLLEMGPSIIAHLMVEYYYHPTGYWWELLHEIIHGRKMGAYMYQKPVLFAWCCHFFNYGEHDQAPKFMPTERDRHIRSQFWAENEE